MRPLRPFPLPLGVGTDICSIARIHGILSTPRRQRFLERLLSPEERKRSAGRLVWGEGDAVGTDSDQWKMAGFVAGRYVGVSPFIYPSVSIFIIPMLGPLLKRTTALPPRKRR